MNYIFFNMTACDWISFFISIIITLECVVLLRQPITLRNMPRDVFVMLVGVAGLGSAVSLAEDFHQAHFPGLLLNTGLVYALGYIIFTSAKNGKENLND